MDVTWKELYPWLPQPTPTKVIQSSQLLFSSNVLFVKDSEFTSVQQGPAILASEIELICLIDRTSFTECESDVNNHGAAVSASLVEKGSVSIIRSIFSECLSSGYNTMYIGTSDSGSIELAMSTSARCSGKTDNTNIYNIGMKNGYSITNNVNISHCTSYQFSGILTDHTKGIRLSFSNICNNTSTDSIIVYLMNGLLEQSNLISNVEYITPGKRLFNGVITINSPNSTVKVFQCYISNNTHLSKIAINRGTIEYIRCYIAGDDLSTSGDVQIKSKVSFDRYIITLYASKDIPAEIPYKPEMTNGRSNLAKGLKWLLSTLFCFSLRESLFPRESFSPRESRSSSEQNKYILF